MKKIFSHENRMIVFNMKNLLQADGIETVVVNEFAAGGVGDLATFDTWPELWLEDESRLAEAEAILRDVQTNNGGRSWFCRQCQEQNEAAFQICWKCGRAFE
ncbi:MAG: hypothetical protein [Olavius algarvensis Gamma 3 endosymbiont]|nr:MAG: hypothetical protein [Olavius algarvensis Gamma 3 endosymbiont]